MEFIKYSPGLVGGHCLPVDPYYFCMVCKKLEFKYGNYFNGRKTNNEMVKFTEKNNFEKNQKI